MISSVNFSQATVNRPPMTPKTVLVVDDDPINLLLTSRILQKYGCRVLMANSPKQAIELFRQYTQLIDILLSDVNMPEMNGYGLAESLRSLNPQLPVLFMSAGQDKEGPKRNLSVLCKPFTFEDLIESVVAALHSCPMSVRGLESN